MRLFILSAMLGVVLAGGIFGAKSSDSVELSAQRRHAAIEQAVDGAP